jgi:hypothetical protein
MQSRETQKKKKQRFQGIYSHPRGYNEHEKGKEQGPDMLNDLVQSHRLYPSVAV